MISKQLYHQIFFGASDSQTCIRDQLVLVEDACIAPRCNLQAITRVYFTKICKITEQHALYQSTQFPNRLNKISMANDADPRFGNPAKNLTIYFEIEAKCSQFNSGTLETTIPIHRSPKPKTA